VNFANPAFLWAAAALAPLVAIYLLRVRPRRHRSTALFLWQSLLTRRQTSSLFQRLRQLWSLLLMALAVPLRHQKRRTKAALRRRKGVEAARKGDL